MFNACHPKTEVVDCWTAVTNLFQREKGPSSSATQTSPSEGSLAAVSSVTQKTGPDLTDNDASTPVPTGPLLPSLTVEEQERLRRALDRVAHQKSTTVANQQPLPGEDPDERTETTTIANSILESPSFLSILTKAAAEIALDFSEKEIDSENVIGKYQEFSDDDNPEATIQRLLQVAKKTEALQKRYGHHLERMDLLFRTFGSVLAPLEPCWQSLQNVLANDVAITEELRILMGCSGSAETLSLLWNAIEGKTILQDDDNICHVEQLIQLCFHCAIARSFLVTNNDKEQRKLQSTIEQSHDKSSQNAIQSLLRSFFEFESTSTDDEITARHQERFLRWHQCQIPSLLCALPLLLRALLLPSLEVLEDQNINSTVGNKFLFPRLDNDQDSENLLFPSPSSSNGQSSTWLFSVACTIPLQRHPGKVWHRLYSSLSEGFNLATLEHNLVGYHGATLILVEAFDKKSKTNVTFGSFASRPWKRQGGPSPDFFGDNHSFLFQLKPRFRIWRARHVPRGNFQYFHFDNRLVTGTTTLYSTTTATDTKYAQGIGMGGSKRRPRFYVAATLDKCHLGSEDATYESNVSSNVQNTTGNVPCNDDDDYWDLLSLEIWGIGGHDALQALNRHHTKETDRVQKARQVDKSAFLNDFRSGLIESKMFAFHEEMRNRDGGCLLDEE